MDDTQRIVKCGNLSLHSPGGFFKKRWHGKYLVLYDGSKSGVKRLELFDSEIKFKKQNPAKIIPLVDCVRVVTCQRHKTTYTFEVRTNDQFYLLAAQSFSDMNDWVNCLRFVAFGASATATAGSSQPNAIQQQQHLASLAAAAVASAKRQSAAAAAATEQSGGASKLITAQGGGRCIDVLLEKRTNLQQSGGSSAVILNSNNNNNNNNNNLSQAAADRTADYVRSLATSSTSGQTLASAMGGGGGGGANMSQQQEATEGSVRNTPTLAVGGSVGVQPKQPITASQAAAAAASALAKTRQRQPSLLGSCKPQPPDDSPFIQTIPAQTTTTTTNLVTPIGERGVSKASGILGPMDTLTPTVRGQLILTSKATPGGFSGNNKQTQLQAAHKPPINIQATLDEEEENMLYCSIEDNPSEHNYRVKVIETELSLRCQLRCYQLTAPTTISQQYEQLGRFQSPSSSLPATQADHMCGPQQVTFYQLIIGPQELTLLNDYAAAASLRQHLLAGQNSQQQGLWSWPYQCIRRYGFDKDNCFMFEAGRKCTSGPGQFIVQTPKAYQIYQDVVKFVNELRSVSAGGAQPMSGPLDNGSNGLPLPPPPLTKSKETTNSTHSLQATNTNSGTQVVAINSWPVNNNNNNQLPNEQPPNETTKTDSDSRQQFFNNLRQLDSNPPPLPPPTQQTKPTSNSIVPIHQAKSQPNISHIPSVVSSAAVLECKQVAPKPIQVDYTKSSSKIHQISPSPSPSSSTLSSSTTTSHHHESIENKRAPSIGQSAKQLAPPVEQLFKCGSDQTSGKLQQTIDNKNAKKERASSGNNNALVVSASIATTNSTSETDESGYEHGDDFPDNSLPISNSSSQQLSGCGAKGGGGEVGAARKRIQEMTSTGGPDSMSSASSTSSGGSPGQSVSRRSGTAAAAAAAALNNQRPANKRAPLVASNGMLNSSNKVFESRESGNNNNNGIQIKSVLELKHNNNQKQTGKPLKPLLPSANLQNLIGRVERITAPEDFETNLIRDVYSEITKLQAKFAITSGSSAEDLLSSSNCSNECSTSTSSENSVVDSAGNSIEEQEEDEEEDDEEDEEQMDQKDRKGRLVLSQPLYTNLRSSDRGSEFKGYQNRERKRGNCHDDMNSEKDDDDEVNDSHWIGGQRKAQSGKNGKYSTEVKLKPQLPPKTPQQQQQQQQHLHQHNNVHDQQSRSTHNSYAHNQPIFDPYLSPPRCGPIYPTILNPIPECGETNGLMMSQPTKIGIKKQAECSLITSDTSLSPTTKPQVPRYSSQSGKDENNLTSDVERFNLKKPSSLKEMRVGRTLEHQNQVPFKNNQPQHQNGQVKSKLPTKHYVINDVQYAKISRNFRSKYESCL